MVAATRMEPPVTDTTQPFWDATKEKRFLVQWCVDCAQPVFYPREVCPRCLGSDLEWREGRGRGVVYAVTVEYKPQNPAMAERAPYAVILNRPSVILSEAKNQVVSLILRFAQNDTGTSG